MLLECLSETRQLSTKSGWKRLGRLQWTKTLLPDTSSMAGQVCVRKEGRFLRNCDRPRASKRRRKQHEWSDWELDHGVSEVFR